MQCESIVCPMCIRVRLQRIRANRVSRVMANATSIFSSPSFRHSVAPGRLHYQADVSAIVAANARQGRICATLRGFDSMQLRYDMTAMAGKGYENERTGWGTAFM